MLDLSGFSSDLPRYDVAKMVYKRFEGSSSVQYIQFVPGKNVQITFKTLELLRWFVIHLFPVRLMWEDTCVRLGMSGNLLNAIFVKVDMFLRTAPLRVSVDGV